MKPQADGLTFKEFDDTILEGDQGPPLATSEFVRTWTRIVLILAITLATLNGVDPLALI